MLADLIEGIQRDLRAGLFPNEAAVSQGVILPILQGMEWPVFDPQRVAPQYALEGGRVDFALCDDSGRPRIFLEVKAVGKTEGGYIQLLQYAFRHGVPLAVLTDGQEWDFYLPLEEGPYDQRQLPRLDILNREGNESAERLTRYLSRPRVLSGEFLQAAKDDLRSVERDKTIKKTLPRAWKALLDEQDSDLIELLADKVEELCGVRPDVDICSRFFTDLAKRGGTYPDVPKPDILPDPVFPPPSPPTGFSFRDKWYGAYSAREVMIEVFRLFVQRNPTFLERFAARKHGRKRRYIARHREELYPGRPDLCQEHSVEIVPGWWMGTNYSKRSIGEIIRLACEVAGVQFEIDLRVNLG